jgi:hypothetical protein
MQLENSENPVDEIKSIENKPRNMSAD